MSDKIRYSIEREIARLQYIRARCENYINKCPGGWLQRYTVGGRAYYRYAFYEADAMPEGKQQPKRPKTEHLKKDDERIGYLVKKSYYEKCVKEIDRSLAKLTDLMAWAERKLPAHQADEEAFEALPKWKQEFLAGEALTMAQRIDAWSKEEYFKNPYHEEAARIETVSGESVRSKSEREIANCLYENGLAYRYDCRVELADGSVYADFVIMHPRTGELTVWEHAGMMDDDDYVAHNYNRLARYAASGFFVGENLILTVETADHPLSTETVKRLIADYFG